MTEITLTIDGDIDEVIATIQGLASGRSLDPLEVTMTAPTDAGPEHPGSPETGDLTTSEVESDPPAHGAVWTTSYVHTFWRNLSDMARQAMIRVSRSPNRMQKRAQLMHTLQLTQRELSGSLSSQGHSLNRLKRRRGDIDLPRPLTYDKINDVYVLDSHFADALNEIGLS